MIILDTNVVSERARLIPEPGVVAWLDRQGGALVWITSITLIDPWAA
jgi:toxin FitB